MPPKRSSTATASSSKRQKVDPIVQAGQTILELASQHEEAEADSESPTPPLTLTASQTRDLIAYTRYLVAASTPKTLSGPELTKEVSRLRNLIENGITKLMTWKPSCKTGSATFAFDGICANPQIMASLLQVPDATKFKAKKWTSSEFEETVFDGFPLEKSVRYDSLFLNGNVNLKWNSETGEYKFSGRYGKMMTT